MLLHCLQNVRSCAGLLAWCSKKPMHELHCQNGHLVRLHLMPLPLKTGGLRAQITLPGSKVSIQWSGAP
jgi:hypothetical protein